jgi:rhodanese-related sulfurtransferase
MSAQPVTNTKLPERKQTTLGLYVTAAQVMAGPTDILLVTCRSGDRSAMAVNQLAAAGFKNATARNSCWCDARPEGSADGIYLAERQAGSWRKG